MSSSLSVLHKARSCCMKIVLLHHNHARLLRSLQSIGRSSSSEGGGANCEGMIVCVAASEGVAASALVSDGGSAAPAVPGALLLPLHRHTLLERAPLPGGLTGAGHGRNSNTERNRDISEFPPTCPLPPDYSQCDCHAVCALAGSQICCGQGDGSD
jgi:hypothetical protein